MTRLVSLTLLAGLAPAQAQAADVEVGVDADIAYAYGSTLNGPGGGLAGHVALGANPLKLGPFGIQAMADFKTTFFVFPDVDQGNTNLITGGLGGRVIVTAMWLRTPKDNGGRGRGVRLDVPIAIHALMGSLNNLRNFTPGGDASIGLAVGLLPAELGIHIGVGALAANQNATGLDGSIWVNTGVDFGLVF